VREQLMFQQDMKWRSGGFPPDRPFFSHQTRHNEERSKQRVKGK
jgi:hypothetical protein